MLSSPGLSPLWWWKAAPGDRWPGFLAGLSHLAASPPSPCRLTDFSKPDAAAQSLSHTASDRARTWSVLAINTVAVNGSEIAGRFISSWGDWEKHQGEDDLWVDGWHVPRISWIWTDFAELLFLLHVYCSSPSCLPVTAAASRTTTKHSGLKLNRDRGRDGVCVCVCVC